MASSNYKYFMYSAAQMRERTEIEKRIGRKFVPGTVVVGAKKLQYTELTGSNNSRYSDAVVVAEGDITKMNYTKIESRKGV